MSELIEPTDPLTAEERDAHELRLSIWLDGYHTRDNEIARLQFEADLWYFCANNPGKRPKDYYAAATDRLWQEASR